MKIAITDACIFIDLYELGLTAAFFGLHLEVHTSYDVFAELYPDQQKLLNEYQSIGKLVIHNLQAEDVLEISSCTYPRALSYTDKTVLHLAKKLDAIVVSSDKAVRNYANRNIIEYHGMLWIFDQLVETGSITTLKAAIKLQEMVRFNMIYQNNADLLKEIARRLKSWTEIG